VLQPGGRKQSSTDPRSHAPLASFASFGLGGFWLLGGAAVASLGTVFLFFVIALVSCPSLSRKSRLALGILWCTPWATLYLVWRSPSSPKLMHLEAIFASYLVPILILVVTAFVVLRVCSRQQQRLAAQRELRIQLLAAFVTLFLVVGLILPQAFPRYEGRVDDLSLTGLFRLSENHRHSAGRR